MLSAGEVIYIIPLALVRTLHNVFLIFKHAVAHIGQLYVPKTFYYHRNYIFCFCIVADDFDMKEYSAKEIIKGIASRKNSVIHYVYRSCYPNVRKLILSNGGNEFDAQDIFQEGLVKVYQKITEHELKLTCKFGTYLYSVCRFLWLNELEKRKPEAGSSSSTEFLTDDQTANMKIRENAELKLYERHFNELSRECQKVLNLYFQNTSMEEICVVMGYKNVQIAKDKKYRCKKSLTDKIHNNPEYKRLQDEIHLAG